VNDLVRFEAQLPQTAANIRAQVNLIQEVMKAVMKEGTHYGTIPGTPKPSLWKPGAEVLGVTFHIASSYRVEDLSAPDCVRYRVACVGTHQATGVVMGEGMGECSSMEEKYKWRKASSRREFDATPEDRRRVKYGYNKAERREYEIQQVRAESADQANTILKMACKRAQVAMTLNVAAASDIFTQDIEDLPPELQPDEDGEQQRQAVRQPKSKSAAPAPPADTGDGAAPDQNGKDRPLTDGERAHIRTKLEAGALTEVDLKTKFGVGVDALTLAQFQAVKKWMSNPAG
jgi:hypothetical protein